MEKLKQYYTEISIGIALFAAVSYFFYNFYAHKNSVEFLSQAKSKLLLAQARATRVLEEKINNENMNSTKSKYASAFSIALKDSGFKILKLEEKSGCIYATVVKNPAAYEKISSILENVSYEEKNENAQIIWHCQEENYKEEKIATKHILTLNAICFFGPNEWQIWVNGKMYDNANNIIDDQYVIEKVSENEVRLKSNAENLILSV